MKTRLFKTNFIIVLVMLTAAVLTGCKVLIQDDMEHETSASSFNVQIPDELEGPYKVDYVIDGDTIIILKDDKRIHVRLIGIDTPESVSHEESENSEYGEIASEYTRSMLEDAEVYLEYDEEKEDQYGRTLAYVYLINVDNELEMLNLKLVEDGYAWAYTFPPNVKYKELFENAYATAKDIRHIPDKK